MATNVPDPAEPKGLDASGAGLGRAERRELRRQRAAEAADTAGSSTAEGGGNLTVGRGGPVQFLRECLAELRRVQWPTRQALWQATAVVIVACVVVGFYLYALDNVFLRAARWLIDQQHAHQSP